MFYPYVFGFIRKTIGDPVLTEDLTQDTFLKMIRGIDRFDPSGRAGFGTWLITIARNCCIDNLRRNKINVADIDELSPNDLALLAKIPDAADEAVRRQEYKQLLLAIDKLPPEQGIAIRLKYEQELTLAEIAERFGVPPKTIKSRIHEGTAKLRKLFKNNGGDDRP